MRRPVGGILDIAPSSQGLCLVPRFPKTMVQSTSGCIASLRRLSNLPTLTLDHLRALLREYVDQTGQVVDLVLIGGLAVITIQSPVYQ